MSNPSWGQTGSPLIRVVTDPSRKRKPHEKWAARTSIAAVPHGMARHILNSVKREGWNMKKVLCRGCEERRYFYINVFCFIPCVTIAITVRPCNSCQFVFTTGRIRFFSPCGLWPQRTPLIYLLLKILLPYLLPTEIHQHNRWRRRKTSQLLFRLRTFPICLNVKGCGTFIL